MKNPLFALGAVLIVGGFAAPAGAQGDGVASQGTLGEVGLLEILKLRLLHPKTDPFSGEYTSRFKGRQFRITQGLRQDDGSEYGETNARWSYSISSHELKVHLNDDLRWKGIEFFYKSKLLGHYTGQTAMGAKARVTAYDETSGSINIIENHLGEPNLHTSMRLSPEQARALVPYLRLEVEGILQAQDGVTTTCEHSKSNGSLDSPNAFVSFECRINATLTRMAYVDARSNAVLAVWPAPADNEVIHTDTVPTKPTAPLIPLVVKAFYPKEGSAIASGTMILKATFNQPMSEASLTVNKLEGAELPACLPRARLLADRRTFVLMCSTVGGRNYGVKVGAKSAAEVSTSSELRFSTSQNAEPTRAVDDALAAAGLNPSDSPIGGLH